MYISTLAIFALNAHPVTNSTITNKLLDAIIRYNLVVTLAFSPSHSRSLYRSVAFSLLFKPIEINAELMQTEPKHAASEPISFRCKNMQRTDHCR